MNGGTGPFKVAEGDGSTTTIDDFKIAKCYPSDCVAQTGENAGQPMSAVCGVGASTRGNIGGMTSGTPSHPALPGTRDHNLDLAQTQNNIFQVTAALTGHRLLRDPDNFDFRPRASQLVDAGAVDTNTYAMARNETSATLVAKSAVATVGSAPDIGAYESGAASYWCDFPTLINEH